MIVHKSNHSILKKIINYFICHTIKCFLRLNLPLRLTFSFLVEPISLIYHLFFSNAMKGMASRCCYTFYCLCLTKGEVKL